VAAVVAVGAVSLDGLGIREPSSALPSTVTSGTWLCPHGGGEGYEGTVSVANPGDQPVTIRVTELDAEASAPPSELEVAPGSQLGVTISATQRSSATFVESFGGWVAAGWLIRGGEGGGGVGAEPCAPVAGRDWVSAAPATGEGEQAFLVVMNPFDVDAVFDVAIFSGGGRAPVRHADLSDVTLKPRRSTAIRLNLYAQGEDALGVSVEVSTGRVAASTLVVADGRGIGSVLASAGTTPRQVLLTPSATGRSSLAVAIPSLSDAAASPPEAVGQIGSTFSATLRSEDAPQPAGGLVERSQEPASAALHPIVTTGPSGIDLVVSEGEPVVAALRTVGLGGDIGATAGSVAPAKSWVVTPTVAGQPSRAGLLLLNPGTSTATVTVTSIPDEGEQASEIGMSIPAGTVAAAPRGFMDGVAGSSLLVVSEGSPVVALGASTSLGNEGLSLFGLAAGMPIPETETETETP
ncbi:MAG TPA: DUF5719 family protein, partial [Actinomycetota bacterium]